MSQMSGQLSREEEKSLNVDDLPFGEEDEVDIDIGFGEDGPIDGPIDGAMSDGSVELDIDFEGGDQEEMVISQNILNMGLGSLRNNDQSFNKKSKRLGD